MIATIGFVWFLAIPRPVQPATDPLQPLRWGAVIAAVGADSLSTLAALRKPGLRESNSLLSGIATKPAVFLAVQSVVTVAVLSFSEQLRKDGHRVWSWIVVGIVSAVRTAAAWHNIRLIQRVK